MYTKSKLAVLDQLRFNVERHTYSLDDMRIQSVTQVIAPFLPYDNVPREIREQALTRGDLVHSLTVLAEKGRSWRDDAKETELEGYVDAWLRFLEVVEPTILDVELRVYHSKYRYAGTLDRLAKVNGRVAVIEIKTGGLVPEYAWQTAAYQEAHNDGLVTNQERALDRYAVKLNADGSYRITQYRERADFDAFLAALTLTNWRTRYA